MGFFFPICYSLQVPKKNGPKDLKDYKPVALTSHIMTFERLILHLLRPQEMVIDIRHSELLLLPVSIEGVDVERVRSYRYLGLQLDDKLDNMYKKVIASVLFYSVVCWGGSLKSRDAMKLDKVPKRVGLVVGVELDSLEEVVERRTLNKMLSIMANPDCT
ncbi:hypothetical protein QTP86_009112 [Hemibagrus guttatus]|nr:hypothetical protein QTP86_009112 [Hemibagrus guttatus]